MMNSITIPTSPTAQENQPMPQQPEQTPTATPTMPVTPNPEPIMQPASVQETSLPNSTIEQQPTPPTTEATPLPIPAMQESTKNMPMPSQSMTTQMESSKPMDQMIPTPEQPETPMADQTPTPILSLPNPNEMAENTDMASEADESTSDSMDDQLPIAIQENNCSDQEMPEEITEEEIIIMNSTEQSIAIYGRDKDNNETCIAQNIGTIAQIIVPSSMKQLKIQQEKPGAELLDATIDNKDISILVVQKNNDPDKAEELTLLPIVKQSEQGVMMYNTTTKDQQVKAMYPKDAVFFYTPTIYYTIPALSARFMTLPIMNKKGMQKTVYLTIPHSKKKIIIPASTQETICVLYSEDDFVMIDDVTESFRK